MEKELQAKYKNITKEVIMLYLTLCKPCQQKNSELKKVLTSKSIKEINSRCQVDLIDMQLNPDGEYKFIMHYQRLHMKLSFLRSLKSKRPQEVTHALLYIFAIIGAPSFLQCNNGREFSSQIIREISNIWSELKLVHGKPQVCQSESSTEEIEEIQKRIFSWMQVNNSPQWAEFLWLIQIIQNQPYHRGMQQTACEDVGRSEAKLDLSQLTAELVSRLHRKNELDQVNKELENTLRAQHEENIDIGTDSSDTEENLSVITNVAKNPPPESRLRFLSCVICEKESIGTGNCVSYLGNVHALHGVSSHEEAVECGQQINGSLCHETSTMKRKQIQRGLHVQPSKMLKPSELAIFTRHRRLDKSLSILCNESRGKTLLLFAVLLMDKNFGLLQCIFPNEGHDFTFSSDLKL
ncbi:SCAN domain-containing protein 3-like [Fukomys damarensis]|uniref:SCAN domain-containing protein 3-like n=1 Tax=Fukomys damarensis TaxID=885580 RepID=UPI00145555F7|nr:SCAN domain-containing protein 3-like [Fukomys damarensis]